MLQSPAAQPASVHRESGLAVSARMDPPQRILLIRPSALGDVCRTVPVLASLRCAFPDAQIDWLVQDTFADAVRAHPALSGVVPFARADLGHAAARGRLGPGARFLRSLRERRYDLALDAQGLARSGLFARATRAPRRVGFADARELGWLGINVRVRVSPDLHTVDRMLELVRAVGVEPVPDVRLFAPPEARERHAADADLAGARYAVLAPGSRWEGKRWPAERFAAVAAGLLRQGFDRVVVVGSRHEGEQCAPVVRLAASDSRVIDRVGRTSVGGLMALVERCTLLIANDSAPLHMAVGFGRPLIALYGPTRIDRVGPYGRAGDVIRHVIPGDLLDHKDAAAGRALMERITVEEVLERAGDGRFPRVSPA